MSTVMSAALRINLLPGGDRARERRLPRIEVGRLLPMGISIAVIASVVALGLHQERGIRAERTRVGDLTAEKARLAPQVELVNKLRAQQSDLTHRLKVVEALSKNRRRAANQIASLPYALPERLWLTAATFGDSQNVRIEGVALSPLTVADLVARLDSIEVFHHANLVVAEAGKIDETAVTRFVVQCRLVE